MIQIKIEDNKIIVVYDTEIMEECDQRNQIYCPEAIFHLKDNVGCIAWDFSGGNDEYNFESWKEEVSSFYYDLIDWDALDKNSVYEFEFEE